MPENVKQKLVCIGNMTNFDKATLVQLFLVQQSQLQDIDRKLQLLLEQVAVLNNNRFGKSSEKLDTENQICFMEVDGNIVFFNEAEAVASLNEYADEDETKPRGRKTKGKREKDIRGLPVNPVEHKMSEEELIAEFGKDGWYELEDEIYRRYSFTPMKVEIEEHHVGVYKSKKDNHFKKAEHPAYLLRNSLVSPSLLAGVWNAKYVNATPLYRQEKEFQRMGLAIDRADMAHWTILCAERYLSIFYVICIRSFMTIMCFRQMRLRFWSRKKTEPMGTSITCGCIVPVRCMRTDRSYCTITSLRVMQAIQEISSRCSRESA